MIKKYMIQIKISLRLKTLSFSFNSKYDNVLLTPACFPSIIILPNKKCGEQCHKITSRGKIFKT